jgi:PBP1b-binding outer membrane lipoprotein LpoB
VRTARYVLAATLLFGACSVDSAPTSRPTPTVTTTVAPQSCVFLADAYRQLSQVNVDYSKISQGYIRLIPQAAAGIDVGPRMSELGDELHALTARLNHLNDRALSAMDECEAAAQD